MTLALLDALGLRGRRSVPVIEAAEAAECGLACLAMIARYHDIDVDLNGLRQRFGASLQGMRLRTMLAIADQLGLRPRALKLEMGDLEKLSLPACLHWDLDHFVVLTKVGKRSAKIHDPAVGARTLDLGEVGQHFTGVAVEFSKAAEFEPVHLRQPTKLSDLWSSVSGLKRTFVPVFLLSLALTLVSFAAPYQMQLVVDEAIYKSDTDLLKVIALGFGGLMLLQTAIQYLRDKTLLVAGNLFGYQLVDNIVRHLQRLPVPYFEKRHLGDILSRVKSTDPIRTALTQGLIGSIIDGLMALLAGIVLFFYSGVLAGVVLLSLVLFLCVMASAYPTMRARTQEQLVASAAEQSVLMESIRGATTIKLMAAETERSLRWRNLYARVINKSVGLANISINTAAAQSIIFGVQSILVIYLGARMVIDGGGFSVGMLIAFLSFKQTFSDRVLSLINQGIQFRLLRVHLDRLSDIVHAPAEALEANAVLDPVKGAISLKNLTFRYGTDEPHILNGCSLEVPEGGFVAITGGSGSGKSTLLKLMLGLYEPEAGEILLDGHRATPAIWRAWRMHVGYVAQDDRLFSGSIADNIAFFDPLLDMRQVQAAAMATQVHDDISRMPMGYLSLVGDMGSALSGGQRQRILLARALYRTPKILILDEGTANLDQQTEDMIADLVTQLPLTRIVVAHRPALVARADMVFGLTKGKLVPLVEFVRQ